MTNLLISCGLSAKSMKKIILLGLFCGVCILNATAQSNALPDAVVAEVSQKDHAIDRSVYMDEEEKICFIDLEQIPVNLRQAAIINDRGDEVMVKSLSEMRVDTIVELDYSDLPKGGYILELRSYRGTTSKAIQL